MAIKLIHRFGQLLTFIYPSLSQNSPPLFASYFTYKTVGGRQGGLSAHRTPGTKDKNSNPERYVQKRELMRFTLFMMDISKCIPVRGNAKNNIHFTNIDKIIFIIKKFKGINDITEKPFL